MVAEQADRGRPEAANAMATAAAATAAPRFHHQWRPDALFIEPGFSADTVELLKRKGQVVRSSRPMGSTQSIMAMPDGLAGASDPRRRGALTAGY